MRILLSSAIVLGLAAAAAHAAVITDPEQGALQMTLLFDEAGKASLLNTSSGPLDVWIYEIWSDAGLLDPVNWYSIKDAVLDDYTLVMSVLGAGALGFGEIFAADYSLVEGRSTPTDWAVFPAGVPWGIGRPSTDPQEDDLTFYYVKPSFVGDKFLGTVVVIPEPTTILLLGFGWLAIAARRNRTCANPKEAKP